jgi:hypothetical protein
MSHQIAVTVLAEVEPGAVDALKTDLDAIHDDGRRSPLPFEHLPVHFARFVVLDATVDLDGAALPPQLVFLSDIDGSARRYLSRLAELAAEPLDWIYRHCVGYPDNPTVNDRAQYLSRHTIKTTATYVNTVGRSVADVRANAEVRRAILDFLDEHDWSSQNPRQVRAAVQEFVGSTPALQAVLRPRKRASLWWRTTENVHFVATIALAVLLAPLLLFVLPIWLIALRLHERRDVPETPPPDSAHATRLADAEGHLVQNQLSAVGLVKPGRLRRATLSVVLWGLNFAARHVYNDGVLSGIRTIHFARWVFLDDKRRLIFASNYDGSLESYMDDFIDNVAWGLNAAFSNGMGYPKTRWLLFGGAKDEPAFKNYLRNHQIPTQVWYSAYGDLTAANLANDAAIRDGLHGTMTDEEIEEWVARL